jgi:peptide/nickel transport system permease protein
MKVGRFALSLGTKIALAGVTLLIVVTFLFVLLRAAPGDPLTYKYHVGGASLSAADYARLRHQAGLDRPVWEQYADYLGDVGRLNLGESFTYTEPVLSLIFSRIPATLILMLSAMITGALIGTTLGIASARRPNRFFDNATRTIFLSGYSIPQFWLAILVIRIFAVELGWFPSTGMVDPRIPSGSFAYVRSVAWHAVLPVAALSLFYVALYARYTRASMLNQTTENYVLTARAKGLTPAEAYHRHVVRNGLLPVLTLVGMSFRYLFGGAVLIETVFSWPGIGLMLFNGILERDYPVIQGVFLFAVLSVLVINLLIDAAYGFLDPRVRLAT